MLEVEHKWPGDNAKKRDLSVFHEGPIKKVRMAYLAVVCCHSTNGVAEIHTEILKNSVFHYFYQLWPQRFNNKTNGVTPRRWIHQANPYLSELITLKLGSDEWITNLGSIANIKKFENDMDFHKRFRECKYRAKLRLAEEVKRLLNIDIDVGSLFDIHIKRIHEYKRQLMNVLGIMYKYLKVKKMSKEERQHVVPRVHIFAGKAAPSYITAKNIIKLISNVADVINKDPDIGDLIKVVFIPNYNVSLAELIVPSSDISEHISTAGTEASGTSNMKFAMNGGLILGTMDGANIEIMNEIGEDNIFIFGARANEVEGFRKSGCVIDKRLHEVLKSITEHLWADERTTTKYFMPLFQTIQHGTDFYLVAKDFPSYVDTQERIDEVWNNVTKWTKMAINTVAGVSKFSSDRTILEYANDIWKIKPCRIPELSDDAKFHM
eukprot:TRINITY_DN2301_c0_g1_i1.p2 TRINITY_DN2301_c0_g1~~TRINITY_DN2301_c0_g1_i1.p2  ORF type:complete len:435 (-),score=81.04 TRINITY_DN2301_c0_g1_i1:34-1338(-)